MPTILLVDNDPAILAALGMTLEWGGYRVCLSEDGQTALVKAGRMMPDLIITDCAMPGMDGIDLCRELRRYPALSAIPVIMVSAQTQVDRIPPLWNAFFLKPISIDALKSTVASLLVTRPLRETLPPAYPDRAMSRWQPISSGLIP